MTNKTIEGIIAQAGALYISKPEKAETLALEGFQKSLHYKQQATSRKAMYILLKALFQQAKYHQALATFKQHEPMLFLHDNDVDAMKIYNQMGNNVYRLHETQMAIDFYNRALTTAYVLNNNNTIANLYNNLGNSYLILPDYNNALRYFEKAYELQKNKELEMLCYLNMAHFYNSVDNGLKAKQYLNYFDSTKFKSIEQQLLFNINKARSLINIENFEAAEETLYKALEPNGHSNPFWSSSMYMLLAENASKSDAQPQIVLNHAKYATTVIEINQLKGGLYENALKYKLKAMNKLNMHDKVLVEGAVYKEKSFNDIRKINRYAILKECLVANFKKDNQKGIVEVKHLLNDLKEDVLQIKAQKRQFAIVA